MTHTELSEYIAWLVQSKGSTAGISADTMAFPIPTDLHVPSDTPGGNGDIPVVYSPSLSGLAQRIHSNPADKLALGSLAAGFETQQEDRYLLAGHDISIGRMFRYMPAHWHTNDFFEIYYCFSGICPIYFKDTSITMKPGTVLIIAPYVLHASPCYQDDSVLFYYMVRSSTFDKVFWNQLPPENLMSSFFRQALTRKDHASYLQFETGADIRIEQLLSRIYEEFCHPENYTPQMLNALMGEFFILLLRHYEGTAKLPRTDDFYWKHEFSAIFSYIQAHYHDMTLAEIAGHFHYSERQITRIVLGCTGSNYAQLVLKLRMEKTASLLKQQNIPIETIAASVGYSTLSSFYRAFGRYYQCTPVEYQSQNC